MECYGNMMEYDELRLYAGDDIRITDKIIITQPTLEQIRKFGERLYFNAVSTLTSVGADMKWQLWDKGIDYTEIDDFDLFVTIISQLISSRKKIYQALMNNPEEHSELLSKLSDMELMNLEKNPMELVLKDIDFADFIPMVAQYGEVKQVVLYNKQRDITINKVIYLQIVDAVRTIHGFKRNSEMPANDQTKLDLIEDARDESALAANKPFRSVIQPLLSTLKVATGQCGNQTIWDMKINEFFYDIKRMGKIEEARRLLQGACSGFANLKEIDKDRLDMFGVI